MLMLLRFGARCFTPRSCFSKPHCVPQLVRRSRVQASCQQKQMGTRATPSFAARTRRLGLFGVLASAGLSTGRAFSLSAGSPVMLRVLRAKGTTGVSSAMSTRMSSAAEFKVALFDATGTLMNLAEAPGKTYSRIAAAHGVPCPSSEELDARFRGVIGDTPPVEYAGPRSADAATREMAWWREVVARVFGEGATHSGFNECFDALYAHYGRGKAWALYPEALPTIDALKRDGWTVGVLSNFDSRLEPVLTDLGVFQASDFFVLPRDSGLIKPDPGQPPPLPLPHMMPCAVALQRNPAALYPASPTRAGLDPCVGPTGRRGVRLCAPSSGGGGRAGSQPGRCTRHHGRRQRSLRRARRRVLRPARRAGRSQGKAFGSGGLLCRSQPLRGRGRRPSSFAASVGVGRAGATRSVPRRCIMSWRWRASAPRKAPSKETSYQKR
jgi:putative hydrolase of the HAD superfamily